MNRDAKIGLFAVLVLVVLVAVMWAKLAGEDEPAAGDTTAASTEGSSSSDTLAAGSDDSLIESIFREQLNSDTPFQGSSYSSSGTSSGTKRSSSARSSYGSGTGSSYTGSTYGSAGTTGSGRTASSSAGTGSLFDNDTSESSTGTTDYARKWSDSSKNTETTAAKTYGSLFEDDTKTTIGGFGTDSSAAGTSDFISAFGGGTGTTTTTTATITGTSGTTTGTRETFGSSTYNRFGRELSEWPKTHTVAKGDTLAAIARASYGSEKHWKLIADANKTILPEPSQLKIGMKLTLPQPPSTAIAGTATTAESTQPTQGLTYKVKKGDTLIAIARTAYGNGNKWRSILEANKTVLPSPQQLAEGMVIRLPANP